MEKVIRKALHIIECALAVITLLVLLLSIGLEIYRMFTVADYFATPDNFLHNILTIVVGLEFVRMLVNMTPANTLEVLIVAIARYVILSHEEPLTNLACVVCIAILFATQRFFIAKEDRKKEFSEVD